MYIIKERLIRLSQIIVLFILCFAISTFITISQRKIINPDEISIQQDILTKKTEEANRITGEVDIKNNEVLEVQKFVDEKIKVIEDKIKKNTPTKKQ